MDERDVVVTHANGDSEPGTARGNRITTASGEYSYPPPGRDAGFTVHAGRSSGCFFDEPVEHAGRQFTEHGLEPIRITREPGQPVVTDDSYDAGRPEKRGWDGYKDELAARAEGQRRAAGGGSPSSGYLGNRGSTRTYKDPRRS